MKDFLRFSFWSLLIVTGVWIYLRYRAIQRKKKEVERQMLLEFYQSKLDSIKSASKKFEMHLDTGNGYFTNHQLTKWKTQHADLYNELNGKPSEFIKLPIEEMQQINNFNNYFLNGEKLRSDFNKDFVEIELKTYNKFFDSVEGRRLDEQQRKAVVTDEDNNLIIAGAGSGKTTTIVGKVNYVIDRYRVNPQEILLISFTNKSAATLAERINIKGVEAKTFHKFGMDVIAGYEGKKPSIYNDDQFKQQLKIYFIELSKDPRYLKRVTDYFMDFLKPFKSQDEFESRGGYIQYMKDQNFRTYKTKELSVKARTTYKREIVKSIEECKIANFLLFNGIEYEYEFPYEFETATEQFGQYRPDFTIKQDGKKIYLEHFGVSRNGDVPTFFAKASETQEQAKIRYWEKLHWARNQHEKNGTVLIETYSYEMSEDVLFDNLTTQLEHAGIKLRPKKSEEIWQIICDVAKDEVNSFISLLGTFIVLLKSNNYSIGEVVDRNNQTQGAFFRQRNSQFIEIIKPIYERYQKHLAERGEIDFSDMVNKASTLILTGTSKQKYSYVIIDEFQDISIGRYQLIKAIKTVNPSCKLFAVGDDWQSIYRFSGSDITLFKEFEKYFGYAVKSKIETTYRFQNPLINLSSEFIQKNPNQARKELKGTSDVKSTNYKIHYSISEDQDDTLEVQRIFDELLTKDVNIQDKEILILGRYSFDIDRLKNGNRVFQIDKQNQIISYSIRAADGKIKKIKAGFMTVHGSKGLEADIVIILNCNSGKLGFPSEMSDDPVLNLLLSEADQFDNGEERRLFYVAMTRARENVFFVADNSSKSKFISELEVKLSQPPNRKCPGCKAAELILKKTGTAKNGNTYKFYGCSDYSYGCDYTTTEWINHLSREKKESK